MDFNTALTPERVMILDHADKKTVLNALVNRMVETGVVDSADNLMQNIYQREELMSTGIGFGLGLPHVRLAGIQDISVAVALVKSGVPDYVSLDGEVVKLVIMIIARPDQNARHLKLLAEISSTVKDPVKRESFFSAATPNELYGLLSQ